MEALKTALEIADEDKKAISQRQLDYLRENLDCRRWADLVFKDLAKATTPSTPLLSINTFTSSYSKANRRLIFLDYDGTLTPIVANPEDAVPSEKCLKILSLLAKDPKNIVYVISGRSQDNLSDFVGHVDRLGLSAEHGCFLRTPSMGEQGAEGWIGQGASEDVMDKDDDIRSHETWRQKAIQVFLEFTERTPGSHIEQKASSLTWHYRLADPDLGVYQAADCHARLLSVFSEGDNRLDAHVESPKSSKPAESQKSSEPHKTTTPTPQVNILKGKKNIEVRPSATSKGKIVRKIVEKHADADFIFCAGDDTTDEDMFGELLIDSGDQGSSDHPDSKRTVMTCAIGSGKRPTRASFHVNNPEQLLSLLQSVL